MRLTAVGLICAMVCFAPGAAARTKPADQCGAGKLSHFVGKPSEAVKRQIRHPQVRFTCMACPRTADYHPTRLNVFFSPATGLVVELGCG